MLIISLFCTIVFLLVGRACYRRGPGGSLTLFFTGVGLLAAAASVGVALTVLFIQLLLHPAITYLWNKKLGEAAGYWRPALLAFVTAYLLMTWISWPSIRKAWQLREEFPVESLEQRLPFREIPATEAPLFPQMDGELSIFENEIELVWREQSSIQRDMFRRLHESKVETFVNAPGFGVARLIRQPNPRILSRGHRSNELIPQATPNEADSKSRSLDDSASSADRLQFHRQLSIDFSHPLGYGYLDDQRRVTGFQSHRFSEPAGAEVLRLELLGLVVHPEPVVYVSDHLPAMHELRAAPTRSPDEFERASLEKLRLGESIVSASSAEGNRMLGAIRSGTRCVTCQGGRRGDLLGAFSYQWR